MKTPPWDDGTLTASLKAEYGRLGDEARAYCDTLASRSTRWAKAYLIGRLEMREELAQARASARLTVRAMLALGERREREGGGACP